MRQSWGTKDTRSVFNAVRMNVSAGVVTFIIGLGAASVSQAAVKGMEKKSLNTKSQAIHLNAKKLDISDCSNLIDDLQAMKKAERSLMQTMVNRSETMAETLNKYADDFNDLKSRNQKIERKDILSLRRTADTFIDHKHREEQLVQRYQKASDSLLKEVALCLQNTQQMAQRSSYND